MNDFTQSRQVFAKPLQNFTALRTFATLRETTIYLNSIH